MRRRLALLMATMLCFTSVPQTGLIGLAAEETAPETELVESTEAAVDSELQSDENLVGGAVETETAAVPETLAPETEAAPTEAAVTEAASEPVTETEPVTEGIPQENQSEAETTETPQETETTVPETVTTETAAPETEATTETEAPTETEALTETEAPTEVETEEAETEEAETEEPDDAVALLAEEDYEVADLKIEGSSSLYYVLEEKQAIQNKVFGLKITYTNGEEYGGIYNISHYDQDYHGNEISKKLYRENGTEIPYTNPLFVDSMGAGSYYWEITCGGKTARQDFKIVSLEELKDGATELQIGSNAVTAGYSNLYLYHFRTENDTQLTFQGDQKGDLHLLCRETASGYINWGIQGTNSSVLGMKIYGNQDYYFYSCSNSKEDISTELTLMEQPQITGIKKISGKEEFLEKLETDYTQGLTVEVSYANQPNQIVRFDRGKGTDSYGNTIDCKVVDKDGNETMFISFCR